MNETRELDTSPESVRRAATTLAAMEGFEDGLRHRTEGTLWMVWGLVFAAIFVSFYAMDISNGRGWDDPDPPASKMLIEGFVPWVGWVGLGAIVTAAVWRSAALHDPDIRARGRALRSLAVMAAVILAMFAITFAGWALEGAFNFEAGRAFNPVMIVAALTFALGLANPLGLSSLGRRVAYRVAAGEVVAALVIAAIPPPSAPWPEMMLLGALGVGLSWVAGGIYETLQG